MLYVISFLYSHCASHLTSRALVVCSVNGLFSLVPRFGSLKRTIKIKISQYSQKLGASSQRKEVRPTTPNPWQADKVELPTICTF